LRSASNVSLREERSGLFRSVLFDHLFKRNAGVDDDRHALSEQIVGVGRWRGPFLLSSPRFYLMIAEPDNLDGSSAPGPAIAVAPAAPLAVTSLKPTTAK